MKLLILQIFNGLFDQVLRKINDQFLSIRKINPQTDCVVINMGNPDVDFKKFNFKTVDLRKYNVKDNYWERKKAAIAIAKQLIADVNPDTVYMRYPLADEFTLSLVNTFPNIVFEHQTFETEELNTYDDKKFYNEELKYGGNVIANSLGIVAVSESIAHYENKRAGIKKRYHILANGITPNEILEINDKHISNGVKSILSVSSFQKWHGLDRLVEGFNLFKNKDEFKVVLVGNGPEFSKIVKMVEEKKLQSFFHFTGQLSLEQIKTISLNSTLGVGSLGHHRIGLIDASPLKHREYILDGLPLIFSCIDEDLNDSLPFVYRYPADDSPIDFNKISDIVDKLNKGIFKKSDIVKYGLENLTWDAKADKLVNFLKDIKNSDNSIFTIAKESKLTLGIPTRNRLEPLLKLLDSITKQSFTDFELLIADDGDMYDLDKEIRNKFPQLNFNIIKGKGISLPVNRQTILDNSKNELVIMVDDDHVMKENCIEELYKSALGTNAAIISAIWPSPNAEVVDFEKVKHLEDYRLDFDNINENSHYWFRNGWKTFAVFHRNQNLIESQFSGGGCVLYRKSIIHKVGGFPDYYSSVSFREDTDISYRVFLSGYKIFINPKAIAYHFPANKGGCRDSKDVDIKREEDGKLFIKKILEWRRNLSSIKDNQKTVKIAANYSKDQDSTKISENSSFSENIKQLIKFIRPRKIIETGTYHGTGTTKIITEALKLYNLNNSTFYSIEVNPNNYVKARGNLEKEGLLNYVKLLNGVSVSRSLLPTYEEIENKTVRNIEYSDIFIDHQENQRASLYYAETNFPETEDNLLEYCLSKFDYQPDFVLLDSGGHMGYVEFTYLLSKLKSDCYIALDDIYHIKHHKSFNFIKQSSNFEIITESKEKFGFCIAKFFREVE